MREAFQVLYFIFIFHLFFILLFDLTSTKAKQNDLMYQFQIGF